MKRIYNIEVDSRDLNNLLMYRLGMEQEHPLNEVHMTVHDVLWQITEQEVDRQQDRNYDLL